MIPMLIDPPAPLLDLAAVKEHLRVDQQITDDDATISALMKAAEAYLDGWSKYLNRCILPQKWRSSFAAFVEVQLPFCDPGQTEIRYFDQGNTSVVLDTSLYAVSNGPVSGCVLFSSAVGSVLVADRPDAVTVDIVFGMQSDVEPIRTAAKIMVASWYRNREGQVELPPAAVALLKPYRKIWA